MYYVALAVVVLIFIWRISSGFEKGMVQELISLIAMVVAGFSVLLILAAIGSYMDHEIGRLVQMITVLTVVCLVYRLINLLFTSLGLIAKLPVIKGLDKLMGGILGFAEAGVIVALLVQILKNWGLSGLI